MATRRYLPPRHLSYLFVAITLALATALVWLGIALLRQDRALEAQRVRDELQRLAISTGDELSRRLNDVDAALVRLVALPPAKRDSAIGHLGANAGTGAVFIDASTSGFQAAPRRVLQYDPSLSGLTTLSPAEYALAESLEFRAREFTAAEREFRRLARSPDVRIAGGAVLRLARVLQKQHRLEEALQAFRQLAGYELEFDGVPSALLAGHATIAILEDLRRQGDARSAAALLAKQMSDGKWRLTRSAFEFYSAELHRRAPESALATREAELLSHAADSLYHGWPSSPFGRVLVRTDSIPVLAVWRTAGPTRVAFLAAPGHTAKAWLAAFDSTLLREGATVALADASGHWVIPPTDTTAPRVTRTEGESGLPWAISVQTIDPTAHSADLAVRRRILFAVLVTAVLIVLMGTYAVARAVNRELAAARMQSDFVSAVSHEFRTPLTSLQQVSELLAAGRVSSEARRTEFHDVLRRETGRLHRLVENLLDFGRFEAGAHEFRFERLAPMDFVEPVVNEFRDEVALRGFDVALSHEETGDVSADRQAMALALRNLLDNAAKYSAGDRRIDVTLSRPNGRVALSVRDRGIGIPPDEHESIFDRFTRGQGVRTSGIPGTGIGLAMVRHIVNEHSGEIRVTSAVGEGSTFTILLNPLDP